MNILYRLFHGKSPKQAAYDFFLKAFEHLTRNLGENMYLENGPDRIIARGTGGEPIIILGAYDDGKFEAKIWGPESHFSRFCNFVKYQSYHLNPEELHKADPKVIAEDLHQVMVLYRKIEPLIEPVYQDAKDKSFKIWREAGEEIGQIIKSNLTTHQKEAA